MDLLEVFNLYKAVLKWLKSVYNNNLNELFCFIFILRILR